jgi:hypothetical protein
MNIPMWHQPECAADGFQGNTHRWSLRRSSRSSGGRRKDPFGRDK